MKIKRKIIMLLLLCALSLTACNTNGDSNSKETTTNKSEIVGEELNTETETQTEPEQPVDTYLADMKAKYNYNEYEFKIMTPATESHMPDSGPALYEAEELNGEIVNDAMYTRNRSVEDALNIKLHVFAHSPGGLGDTFKAASTAYLAGDKTFDIVIPHTLFAAEDMAVKGYLTDWNKIGGMIDLSNSWWDSNAIDTFALAKKKFFGISEFNFGVLGNTYAMFFNKDFVKDYNLENPYELVKSHKWTIDKVLEMTKDMYKDVNGDGKADVGDIYGYSGSDTGVLLGFMWGSGIKLLTADNDGFPHYTFNNDKSIALIDKLIELYYQDNRSYIYGNNEIDIFAAMAEKRMFLQADKIGEIIKLRDSDVNFGMLPYPLYDENQEKYLTYTDAWGGVLCVPNNQDDDELARTAVILDVLSHETMTQLTPKYYEIALKTKYARDDESSEMLDIIYGGVVYDLGYVYSNKNTYIWSFSDIVRKKSNNFASTMEKTQVKVEKYLQKTYDAVAELE